MGSRANTPFAAYGTVRKETLATVAPVSFVWGQDVICSQDVVFEWMLKVGSDCRRGQKQSR